MNIARSRNLLTECEAQTKLKGIKMMRKPLSDNFIKIQALQMVNNITAYVYATVIR